MEVSKQPVHIVLVHGICHGAWCWYKLKPLLEAAGHRVTALDLAASGIDRRSLHELRSFADYTQPLLELMASIPPEEKLVGHSLGGLNISLAMDTYPEKIRVAVFLAAYMPDSTHPPSYVLDQLAYRVRTSAEEWLDTKFLPFGGNETSMFFGPNFISSELYQLCLPEDVALAKMLLRPGSIFAEDLSKKSPFSKQGFGSVKRVYIVI